MLYNQLVMDLYMSYIHYYRACKYLYHHQKIHQGIHNQVMIFYLINRQCKYSLWFRNQYIYMNIAYIKCFLNHHSILWSISIRNCQVFFHLDMINIEFYCNRYMSCNYNCNFNKLEYFIYQIFQWGNYKLVNYF
jgi:hypothetical protein